MIVRPPLLRPALVLDSANTCTQCLLKLQRVKQPQLCGRTFASTSATRAEFFDSRSIILPGSFQRDYFSSHEPRKRGILRNGILMLPSNANMESRSRLSSINTVANSPPAATTSSVINSGVQQELPHRRRKRLKEEAESQSAEQSIPPDASARLSAISSTLPTKSLRRKLAAYLALTKPRLSFLILLTTTSTYGLYPISSLLTLDATMTQLPTLSTSTLTFLFLTTGTFLSCSSANTLNMIFEPKYDAQMSRTRNRPLVRGLVSRRAAVLFAIATGVAGVSLLYVGTNPTVAALSAANIGIYAFAYTPLKRIHVVNTWVGAIVGAIPPMMGWVAAAGQTASTGHDTWRDMLFSEDSIGGWIVAGMLFAWQFPHFNSLSHLIRDEYKAAGHQMMAWVNPARNARVALRYSLLMFPLCFGFYWVGIVNEGFLVSSTLANGWLVREAYRFWQHQGAKGTARGLFWASVWQLPILLVGGLVTKRGVWDGVSRRIFGVPDLEDDEDDGEWYEDGGKVGSEKLVSPSRVALSTV